MGSTQIFTTGPRISRTHLALLQKFPVGKRTEAMESFFKAFSLRRYFHMHSLMKGPLRSIYTADVFSSFPDKRETTPLLRAITMKYSRYFNFGVIRKPSQEIMQNFQVKQIPTILVMIGTEGTHNGKQIIKFSSVFYDVKLYGGISYLNLTTFFYSVHEKHWAEHPDAKKYKGELGLKEFFVEDVREILARDADVFSEKDGNDALEIETGKGSEAIEITSANHKRICTDSALGLCLIYFLDAKSERYLKNALKLYKDLTQMPKMKG